MIGIFMFKMFSLVWQQNSKINKSKTTHNQKKHLECNQSNQINIENRMIVGQKHKMYQRPQPAYQFDKFLKIRSQKQSIIQSQSEPIAQKIQGFQELLRLTKTGSSICAQNINKRHLNSQLKNKTSSSKTLNAFCHSNNEHDFNKFEDIQSDQAQIKKLNKMVYGITEWEHDREKESFHEQRKSNPPKSSKLEKRAKVSANNQKPFDRKMQQRKQLAYSSSEGNKFRKFYTPMNKYQAKSELDRINSQFIKTSVHLNYPKTLLQNNLFSQNEQHFKDLKRKIKQLQIKAKNQYGLKFQHKKIDSSKSNKNQLFDHSGSKDNSEQKQNEQFDFSDLQLGPILSRQFTNKYKNYHRMLDQQNINGTDSSVPKSLIDIVQNKGQSYHNFKLASPKSAFGNPFNLKKNIIKKAYIHRPRSFKPAYTYVRI